MIAALAGCGASPARAPVTDMRAPEPKKPPVRAAVQAEPDWRPKTYTVKKGDTLYSIALDHGLDYKELAQWNNLDNPNRLRIGQQLRIASSQEQVVTPAPVTSAVEVRPLGAPEAPRAEPLKSEAVRPVEAPPGEASGLAAARQPVPTPLEPSRTVPGLKTEPKALKLPYSEQNLALLQATGTAPAVSTSSAQVPSPVEGPPKAESGAQDASTTKAEPAPPKPARPEPKPDEPAAEDALAWVWPTQGKVIAGFSEATKGVDIAGRAGQPVVASAAGKVVYSGSGLRGYGKLIIIKHNKTYLSAYAHNDQLLVKEGQSVSKGQKIAEMGSSDADRVKLHFEIRRLGKPVDPLKHLPDIS